MFAVSGLNDETYYTRNGNFMFTLADGGNMLSNTEGLPVLDTNGNPIILGEEYVTNNLSVDKNGTLMYPDENNNLQSLGITIGVYQFNNPNGLFKMSESLYEQTVASGEPINESGGVYVEKSKVVQGYLEGSNVQIADEMVNMIVTQRAYEMNSKAITTSDEMLQQANNLRR